MGEKRLLYKRDSMTTNGNALSAGIKRPCRPGRARNDKKATPSRGGGSEVRIGNVVGISLGDRFIGMGCLVVDLHGWRFGTGNDRTRLFFSVFGFSLNLRNGWNVIFGKVRLVIALSPMRIFRIRTAHACFSHVITSSVVFPERVYGYLNEYGLSDY